MRIATAGSVGLAIVVVVMLAAMPAGAQPAPNAEPALEQALGRFISEWLSAMPLNSRFDGLISTLPGDRSFIPIDARDPAAAFDARAPLAAGEFQRELQAFLTKIQPGGREAMQAVDERVAPELWELLNARRLSPRYLPSVPAVAYRLRNFESYEWIVPRTPAYRRSIPELITGGRHLEGVICRVRAAEDVPPALLFMFWVDEGTATAPAWRLLGLSAVPSQ